MLSPPLERSQKPERALLFKRGDEPPLPVSFFFHRRSREIPKKGIPREISRPFPSAIFGISFPPKKRNFPSSLSAPRYLLFWKKCPAGIPFFPVLSIVCSFSRQKCQGREGFSFSRSLLPFYFSLLGHSVPFSRSIIFFFFPTRVKELFLFRVPFPPLRIELLLF